MSKSRTRNTVAEIAGFVARGHSQSPANCRVLLDEIAAARAGNAQAAETILALKTSLTATAGAVAEHVETILALRKEVEALRSALKPFAESADGRRAKDYRGSVCFPQKFLLDARAALATEAE